MIRLVVFEEFKIIGGVNHRDLWYIHKMDLVCSGVDLLKGRRIQLPPLTPPAHR